jgi:hypothetical protein
MWMILLIALGVAGTVSTFSLLRAVSSNSFAAKAHRLFTPQIDNHGPEYQKIYGEIDPVLTLRDVEALRAHDSAHLQAAIYKSVFHSFRDYRCARSQRLCYGRWDHWNNHPLG